MIVVPVNAKYKDKFLIRIGVVNTTTTAHGTGVMNMKRTIFSIIVLLAGMMNPLQASGGELSLTMEEKVWLREHPKIRVHNEMDWPPFNFNENGRPQGLSIDYMNLVASTAGLQVEYISGPTWQQFLDMTRSDELDVMLNINQT